MIEFSRKRPKGLELSEDLREQAEGYMRFLSFGHSYWIPLTKKMKKAFGIYRRGSQLDFKEMDEYDVADILQTILRALHLQVRDTVGAKIAGDLSAQLTGFLRARFDTAIRGAVDQRLTEKLLPPAEGEEPNVAEIEGKAATNQET
jgi:hypothetical protein